MPTLPHPVKISADAMNDCAFSISFRYIRAFTHYELFVYFRSSCYYFIKITCNNKCFIQITMAVVERLSRVKI